MPFAKSDGAMIYWHEIGAGKPIVLIMGLGCCSSMWYRLAPRLARTNRVIMLDNRGVGQTHVVRRGTAHRIRSMARDVTAVLDAAEVPAAHVVGFSMGGMIAQQMAIAHSERMESLTLIGTNCGGIFATLGRSEALNVLFAKGRMTAEEAFDTMAPHVYARATSEELIAEDKIVRLANHPAYEDFRAQLSGIMSWSSHSHLPQIKLPTMVVHGLEDALVPPANGRLLAQRIPGAELVELEDASHWTHTDRPAEVHRLVKDFIDAA